MSLMMFSKESEWLRCLAGRFCRHLSACLRMLAWVLMAGAVMLPMTKMALALEVHGIAWPNVLFPEKNMSPYWVAELVVQNGVPMQIQAVDIAGGAERAQRFYREWLQSKSEYAQTTLDGVPILSAREGNFRITVEFRLPQHGKQQIRISSALIYGAVPEVVGAQLQRSTAMAVPLGTDQLSDTFSFDDDLVNRTTAWGNTLSVEANELYIREQAIASGWTVIRHRTIKGGLRVQLVLRRSRQEAVVAIAHNGQHCSIVISNTLQT